MRLAIHPWYKYSFIFFEPRANIVLVILWHFSLFIATILYTETEVEYSLNRIAITSLLAFFLHSCVVRVLCSIEVSQNSLLPSQVPLGTNAKRFHLLMTNTYHITTNRFNNPPPPPPTKVLANKTQPPRKVSKKVLRLPNDVIDLLPS